MSALTEALDQAKANGSSLHLWPAAQVAKDLVRSHPDFQEVDPWTLVEDIRNWQQEQRRLTIGLCTCGHTIEEHDSQEIGECQDRTCVCPTFTEAKNVVEVIDEAGDITWPPVSGEGMRP